MAKTQTGGVESSAPFIATLPIYLLLFVLELIILCHFVIKSYKSKIVKLFKQFAVTLLIIILMTLFIELWSILFDFSSKLPRRNGYCFVEMYVRILSFILLEAIMFLFWIVRINQVFRFSAFALSQKFVRSIYIIIPILVLSSMILLSVNMDTKYYLVDTSFNSSLENGHGCIVEVYHGGSKTVKAVLIIGQILAFSLNIFYGVLFYRKLHEFQFVCATAIKSSARAGKPNAIDLLMQKHTLLAVISAVCSIIAYVIFNVLVFGAATPSDNIYAFQIGFLLIDIDMFIKSVTMLLMFSLYTRRFYQLCCCCIKISAFDYALCCAKCCVRSCSCCGSFCCGHCSEIDPDDFNHQIPVFLKLKKETILRLNTEEVDDDKYHFDKQTYSSRDLDTAIGTEFYIVKKLPFKYYCALIKVSVAENKKVKEQFDEKIYNFARDGEEVKNEEAIFTQIKKHKARKQSLTRHRNEKAKYGYFRDSDEANSAVSAHNFYFTKSQCKYPFIVALKCNAYASNANGTLIARYIQARIEDSIVNVAKIEKFKYEPLLQEIVNEVRTKKMDKNVLFKRLYSKIVSDNKEEKEQLQTVKKQKSKKTSLSLNMTKTVQTVKKQKSKKTSLSLNMAKTIIVYKNDKNDNYVSVAPKTPKTPTIEEEENNNNNTIDKDDKLKK